MFTVTESVSIARSPAEVFAFFIDGTKRPAWDTTVVSEQLTSPEPVGLGSTLRTRMRVLGREIEFDWRVTAFEPPAAMATTSVAGMFPTTASFAFAPSGDRCHVTAMIEGSPAGMLAMAEPMIAQSVRSNLADGLQRARSLLEAAS